MIPLIAAVFKSRRFLTWAATLLITAALLLFVPQFNLLNYYFSLAIAVVAPLAAGLVAVRIATDWRALGEGPVLAAAAAATLALLLIPLLVVALGSLGVSNCDPIGGLQRYAMGPGLGSLYATAFGLLCGATGRRRPATLAFLGWWLLEAGLNLWHFYHHPPIFAYNSFLGYVAGAVYDDLLGSDRAYLWFRLYTTLQALLFLAVAWLEPRRHTLRRRHALPLLPLLAGILALYLYRGDLGFEIDGQDIQDRLGGVRETPHFVLHFDASDPELRARIGSLARDHEFRYQQLKALLGVAPPHKVHSFLYATAAQKKQLMGAGRTYIAKPWSGEIHLHALYEGDPVLRHELAHVFGAQIAGGLFRIPTQYGLLPKMAIVEGFAVAMTDLKGRLTLHQWSAAMESLELAPPMTQILDAFGFLGTHSGQAYTLSGSFLRWLYDTQKLPRFQTLYRTGSLQTAYGVAPSALFSAWRAFLSDRAQVPLSPDDLAVARARFDAPSRFHRVCALEIAAWEAEAADAAGRGDTDQALALRRLVVAQDAQNPDKRWGLINALIAAGDLDEAADIATHLTTDPTASRHLKARAKGRLADIAWRRGDLETAHALYLGLSAEPMDEASQRLFLVSARATAHPDPAVERGLRRYLLTGRARSQEEATALLQGLIQDHPTSALLHYLLARRLAMGGLSREADQQHAIAIRLGLNSPLLERAAWQQRARLALSRGEIRAARAAFSQALALHTDQGFRDIVSDWIDRCDWLLTGRVVETPRGSPSPR